ncbi:23040_t:CDS:2, partial [Racocetra persica]
GSKEAKNTDSDAASSLKAELLLARRTIQNILFEEGQSSPSLPTAVFIVFDDYREPTISILERTKVFPIIPIQYIWKDKSEATCLYLQIPIHFA